MSWRLYTPGLCRGPGHRSEHATYSLCLQGHLRLKDLKTDNRPKNRSLRPDLVSTMTEILPGLWGEATGGAPEGSRRLLGRLLYLAFHLELCPTPKHILYRVHFGLVDSRTPYYKVKEKTTPNLSLLRICLFLLRNPFAQSKSPLCGAWLVSGKQRATSPPNSLLVGTSRSTGRQEAAPGWCPPV